MDDNLMEINNDDNEEQVSEEKKDEIEVKPFVHIQNKFRRIFFVYLMINNFLFRH